MRFLYTEATDAYPYTPTNEDWAEYVEYLDSLESGDEYPEEEGEEDFLEIFEETPF